MRTKLVREIRHGMLIVRIRKARSKFKVCYKLTMHRLFRNGDLWHESTRFGQDDVPLMRFLLNEAHTWILEQDDQV